MLAPGANGKLSVSNASANVNIWAGNTNSGGTTRSTLDLSALDGTLGGGDLSDADERRGDAPWGQLGRADSRRADA